MLVFIENDYYCVEFELFYVEFMYSYCMVFKFYIIL